MLSFSTWGAMNMLILPPYKPFLNPQWVVRTSSLDWTRLEPGWSDGPNVSSYFVYIYGTWLHKKGFWEKVFTGLIPSTALLQLKQLSTGYSYLTFMGEEGRVLIAIMPLTAFILHDERHYGAISYPSSFKGCIFQFSNLQETTKCLIMSHYHSTNQLHLPVDCSCTNWLCCDRLVALNLKSISSAVHFKSLGPNKLTPGFLHFPKEPINVFGVLFYFCLHWLRACPDALCTWTCLCVTEQSTKPSVSQSPVITMMAIRHSTQDFNYDENLVKLQCVLFCAEFDISFRFNSKMLYRLLKQHEN